LRGFSGTGLEAQSSQTDAVKSLIRWESPHPLSIAGVKNHPPEAYRIVERVFLDGGRIALVVEEVGLEEDEHAAFGLHRP
jgi:hypothetical protein